MTQKIKHNLRKIKDPGSAMTHFIAMVLAAAAAVPLLIKGSRSPEQFHLAALAVFILSMIGLYGASTIYHTLDISPKINQLLRKIDHMMIFVLIAGTYTPVCLIVLGDQTGWALLALVWIIAVLGIFINAFWITCPKWFSSMIYIAMGWVCILAAAPFAACGFFSYHSMTAEQLFWAWCKSELLSPKRLVYRYNSYYYDAIQGGMRMKKPKQKKRSRKERRH